MSVKRLTNAALLTGIALIIHIVEQQIPPLVPIPGVKMGLANIITIYAMFTLGPKDTACILAARIFLGAVFSGRPVSLLYSFSGGLLCYLAMLLIRKLVPADQIWVCSVLGAIFHNIGQIFAAILVTRTPALICYLPVLLISGILAGLFTGLCAQFVVRRLCYTHSGGNAG